MNYTHRVVAVGGTFDHFHAGHESLLATAFRTGEKVVVGVTNEEMTRGKVLPALIESYETRVGSVRSFLKRHNVVKKAEIVKLTDPFGPVTRRKDIEAIIVGPRFSKKAVDELKKHVRIIHCPVVHAETGNYLSSTSIRMGRVNRKGKTYRFPDHSLVLPEEGRKQLKKPLGKLSKHLPIIGKQQFVIAVGDETVKRFLSAGITPSLSIIDFHVQRRLVYASLSDVGFSTETKGRVVKSPSGMLTPSLAREIKRAIRRSLLSSKPEVIRVVGEDDLATLLCILYAPLSSVVYYGQPGEGVVQVDVTEGKKEEIARLLEKFYPSL